MLAIVDLDWHLYGKYEFVHTQDLTVGTNSYPSHHHQYEFVTDASRQYEFLRIRTRIVSTNRTQYTTISTNSYRRHHGQDEFVPKISPLVRIRTLK
jgi:hypothetical protein